MGGNCLVRGGNRCDQIGRFPEGRLFASSYSAPKEDFDCQAGLESERAMTAERGCQRRKPPSRPQQNHSPIKSWALRRQRRDAFRKFRFISELFVIAVASARAAKFFFQST